MLRVTDAVKAILLNRAACPKIVCCSKRSLCTALQVAFLMAMAVISARQPGRAGSEMSQSVTLVALGSQRLNDPIALVGGPFLLLQAIPVH